MYLDTINCIKHAINLCVGEVVRVGGSYVMGEVNCETGFGSNYASNFSQEKIQNSKFNTGYCIM